MVLQKDGEYPWKAPTPGVCGNCGNPIVVQIFKGGLWCSDKCRKALGYDYTPKGNK